MLLVPQLPFVPAGTASSTATSALRRRRAKEVAVKDGSDKKRGIEGEVPAHTPPATATGGRSSGSSDRPAEANQWPTAAPQRTRSRLGWLGRAAEVSRSFGNFSLLPLVGLTA